MFNGTPRTPTLNFKKYNSKYCLLLEGNNTHTLNKHFFILTMNTRTATDNTDTETANDLFWHQMKQGKIVIVK